MEDRDPNNQDVPSTYWGDPSFIGIAGTYFAEKEDAAALYKVHHVNDEALQGYDHNQEQHDRHLQELCCAGVEREPVYTSGYDFRFSIIDCTSPNPDPNYPCPYEGEVSCWDTSRVSDMNYAFAKSYFNNPLDCWNVSQVTSMKNMFAQAYSFNQPLDSWNVSQVNDMKSMFAEAPR